MMRMAPVLVTMLAAVLAAGEADMAWAAKSGKKKESKRPQAKEKKPKEKKTASSSSSTGRKRPSARPSYARVAAKAPEPVLAPAEEYRRMSARG